MVDDALKERLKSVSLVVTTLLTSLHDTTTENLNKGFKVATDNLDKLANTTERIMERVEQILEILADSPQVITLITVLIIVLMAIVINLLIGMQNMKLAKTLKFDSKKNDNDNDNQVAYSRPDTTLSQFGWTSDISTRLDQKIGHFFKAFRPATLTF